MDSSMCTTMRQHIAAVRETLFADRALIGPYTGVRAIVPIQFGIRSKYFVADRANMRIVTCMQELVRLESIRFLGGFRA